MRRRLAVLSVSALAALALPAGAVAAPTAAPAARPAHTERMVHLSCDRTARARVTVTWLSERSARISWTLSDLAGGRRPALRIVGLDFNGARPALQQQFFGDDHKIVLRSGAGTRRSGGRTWTPARLGKLDKVQVWIWNLGAGCGYNVVKRLNDFSYSPTGTEPQSFARTRALRTRIKKVALAQYHGGNHESGENCSKYVNAFYSPNICQPWCADFAWWVWMKAGVKGAKAYNSSYTNDFRDEWRVRFKPLGGKRKPAVGDVMVQKHSTDGTNGHVGVVIATHGWKVKVVHGNWSDAVQLQDWTNPFTYTSDGGRKRVVGFASPA